MCRSISNWTLTRSFCYANYKILNVMSGCSCDEQNPVEGVVHEGFFLEFIDQTVVSIASSDSCFLEKWIPCFLHHPEKSAHFHADQTCSRKQNHYAYFYDLFMYFCVEKFPCTLLEISWSERLQLWENRSVVTYVRT